MLTLAKLNSSRLALARAFNLWRALLVTFVTGVATSVQAEIGPHLQRREDAWFQRKLLVGLIIVLVVAGLVYAFSRKGGDSDK